ncbi:MAG: hypothetical protein WBM13_14020 [Bacteroidia bacterium]
MNWIDYLLTLTTSVLNTKDETERNNKLNYFKNIASFDVLRTPKTMSVGASLDNGTELPFNNWIQLLVAEKIKGVKIGNFSDANKPMPDHIMAAFAGGNEHLLQVVTDKKCRTYVLKIAYGPSHLMTFTHLVQLIDAQPLKQAIWDRVLELVNDSNGMNNKPIIASNDIRRALMDGNPNEVPEYLLNDLVAEIQVECIARDTAFILPPNFDSFLYQIKDDFFSNMGSQPLFLLTKKQFTAIELLSLIDAQQFPEQVWQKYEDDLKLYGESVSPLLIDKQFDAYVQSLNTDELNTFSYTITTVICFVCEQNKTMPVIPEHLKDHFESELEHKRANARSASDKWYLKPNEDNWTMYYFDLLSTEHEILLSEVETNTRANFIKALTEIEVFATRIQSSFAEAFRLAHFFMTAELPLGNFDEEHTTTIATLLIEKGFSERALEVFKKKSFYLVEFDKMAFSSHKVFSLFAIGIADVFGGMGSWNDEYIPENEDYEYYQRVSAQLYAALKQLFIATLSN